MSREAECRKQIEALKIAFDTMTVEPETVMCDILTNIALSLAQIADKLNTHITVVTLDSKAVICAYDEARGLIGGRGGE